MYSKKRIALAVLRFTDKANQEITIKWIKTLQLASRKHLQTTVLSYFSL